MARVIKPAPDPVEELVRRLKALETKTAKLQQVKTVTHTTTVDGV